MKIITTGTLQRDRKPVPIGTALDLPDAEAQRLIALEVAVSGETPADTSGLTENQKGFQALTASQAITLVAAASVLDDVKSFQEAEQARAKGPRKTVLDALESRAAALQPKS